jgi:hypothetical protein
MVSSIVLKKCNSLIPWILLLTYIAVGSFVKFVSSNSWLYLTMTGIALVTTERWIRSP